MTTIQNVIYTGKTHTTGGRNGQARSSDGRLDVALSSPGSTGSGTNPEQLFAAGWSACFIGAIGKAAQVHDVKLPADLAVDAEIDLASTEAGYVLQARLNVNLPGVPHDVAQKLVDTAHATCPYSKMSRGNINVEIRIA